MQEAGICKRIHGGAVLVQSEELSIWKNRYPPEKSIDAPQMASIAERAARLIAPGSCIYLDAGNTMAQLAQYIKNIPDLMVLTPNPTVINELARTQVRLISLGGELVRDKKGFIVNRLVTLDDYALDMAFISCAGLDPNHGIVMEYDDYGVPRETIRGLAKKLVLVANSEKMNKKSFINACPLSFIDIVVVDSGIRKQDRELLSGSGIEVVLA